MGSIGELMTQKKYKNPPIVEALCEFRFEPSDVWNFTIPGKFHIHEKIKNEYPNIRHANVIEATVDTTGNNDPNVSVRKEIARIQLVQEDGKRLISLGPDVLSINVLKPYEGWEEFRPRILNALKAYWEVVSPKSVNRIGLRYINKIETPSEDVKLSTYFHIKPHECDELPKNFGKFLTRTEYFYPDDIKLILVHATTGTQENKLGFLLDLDLVWENESLDNIEKILDITDKLHEIEGKAFEALITDQTRNLFNA